MAWSLAAIRDPRADPRSNRPWFELEAKRFMWQLSCEKVVFSINSCGPGSLKKGGIGTIHIITIKNHPIGSIYTTYITTYIRLIYTTCSPCQLGGIIHITDPTFFREPGRQLYWFQPKRKKLVVWVAPRNSNHNHKGIKGIQMGS